MSEQDNAKVAQALFDNINAHDLDKNDELQVADVKLEAPGGLGLMGREPAKAYTQGFLTAFPDLHFDTTLTIAQGDNVVVNWTATGTHNGPLTTPSGNKIPPTGKKVMVTGSSTFEIKNGKITRNWIHWDMASLLGQLGLMPPM